MAQPAKPNRPKTQVVTKADAKKTTKSVRRPSQSVERGDPKHKENARMMQVAGWIVGGGLVLLISLIGYNEYGKGQEEKAKPVEEKQATPAMTRPIPSSTLASDTDKTTTPDKPDAAAEDGKKDDKKPNPNVMDENDPLATYAKGIKWIPVETQNEINKQIESLTKEDFVPQDVEAAKKALIKMGWKSVPLLLEKFRVQDLDTDAGGDAGNVIFSVLSKITGKGGNASDKNFYFSPFQQAPAQRRQVARAWCRWWNENAEEHQADLDGTAKPAEPKPAEAGK